MKPQESSSFNLRQVQELRKLVARGEGLTLEFKRKASFPEKIVREMIAFANTGGGILLVGVNDDGAIPGLKYPEDESHVIKEALNKVYPRLQCAELFIPIGNSRTVIQYTITEGKNKPHSFLLGKDRYESYVRVNDQSIRASKEVREIVRRLQRQKDVKFHYGDHEKWLMAYLDTNQHITLDKFVELTALKRSYASKKLVLLVLADVLKITPHERGDLFSLAFRV